MTVSDTVAPTITVTGSTSQTITVGDSYTDAGATATDACDSTITVTSAGSVDTATIGTYTITYSARDDSNNSASQQTRTVTVQAASDTTEDDTNQDETEETEETESGDAVVTTNGKFLVVTVDGVTIDRLKIGKTVLKPKYYELRIKSLYKRYQTVVVLAARKSVAKLIVVRLTTNNQLKKKVVKKITFQERKPLKLSVKRQTKRIIARVGKGDEAVRVRYRLTKAGKLKLVVL